MILLFLPEILSFFLSFLAKRQVINLVNQLKEILPLKNAFTLSLLGFWATSLEPGVLEMHGVSLFLVLTSLLRVSLTFAIAFTFFFSSTLLREVQESSFLASQARVVHTIGALAEAATRAGEGGSGGAKKMAAGGFL